MTRYSQGDVILLRYPFTDLQTTKQRAAIITSANWFNQQPNDLVLVAITSRIPSILTRDEMALSPDDLHNAGLPKPPIVRLGKIATLERSLVRERLGAPPQSTLADVINGVCQVVKEQPYVRLVSARRFSPTGGVRNHHDKRVH